MAVRVDEEVVIPRRQWYQLIDIFTRIDELLEVLVKEVDYTNRLLSRLVGIPPPPPTIPTPVIEVPPVTTVEVALNNRYKVFNLDLSIPRKDEPLGIRDLGVVANCATVVRMDSPAYWRRNDPRTGDLEELRLGYEVYNFRIEELYITNEAGEGYLTIVIEWRE